MSTAVLTNRWELTSVANTSLKAAARFWFVVTVIGQLVFAFTVASFYGLTALRGDFHGWSKHFTHGWVPGDTMGNFAIAMHLASAVVTTYMGDGNNPLAIANYQKSLQLNPKNRGAFLTLQKLNAP